MVSLSPKFAGLVACLRLHHEIASLLAQSSFCHLACVATSQSILKLYRTVVQVISSVCFQALGHHRYQEIRMAAGRWPSILVLFQSACIFLQFEDWALRALQTFSQHGLSPEDCHAGAKADAVCLKSKLYWGYTGVKLLLYGGYIKVILGLY